jgi:hypothetical protein
MSGCVVHHVPYITHFVRVKRHSISIIAILLHELSQRMTAFCAAACDHDLRPGSRQSAANGLTNATIAARYQRYLAIQPEKLVNRLRASCVHIGFL